MKTEQTYSDRTLLEGLKDGDRESFELLFYRYNKSVYKVALTYLKDAFEAEEVVQETFFKIWKYKSSIKEYLDFRCYLIRIAKGVIFNRFKKKLHEIAYLDQYITEDKCSNQTEEQIYFSDLENMVGAAIKTLPPKRKQIFEMSRLEGKSNKEIARSLNISEKTVENQITAALKIMRNIIQTG